MIIVSNTSPLCYLAWINATYVLPTLFETLIIPVSVLEELQAPGAPEKVRKQVMPPPQWLQIKPVSSDIDKTLGGLHRGERDAILLAEKARASLILLDDQNARKQAINRGLNVTGLIGVLVEAHQKKLLNLTDAVESLLQTSFRIKPAFLKQILDQHG